MITLAISHHIFLTKEQRQSLVKGEELEAVGVSVPVWFEKGSTSEPAVEVFCQYKLTNQRDHFPIKRESRGYTINMPQLPADYKPPKKIPDEKWNLLPEEVKQQYHEKTKKPPTAENLLDEAEGGSGYLRFREYNKIKEGDKVNNIVHYVEIMTVEELMESLS